MENCNPKFPCCPPETANVVQVQSVAGIKGLNNCFVYVQDINTSFYVDNAHRITWISSGVVEESNYDLQANPLNLRNQFLYDPKTKEVHYFSNTGYDATFAATVSLEDLQALEQKVLANTQSITQNTTAIANEVTARDLADEDLQTQITVTKTETDENTARIEQNSASIVSLQDKLETLGIPKLPSAMVYDFVSPAGNNNPSTADNANITVRVVDTSTGAISNSALMMPMASSTKAGSITASDKSRLDAIPINIQETLDDLLSEIAALQSRIATLEAK